MKTKYLIGGAIVALIVLPPLLDPVKKFSLKVTPVDNRTDDGYQRFLGEIEIKIPSASIDQKIPINPSLVNLNDDCAPCHGVDLPLDGGYAIAYFGLTVNGELNVGIDLLKDGKFIKRRLVNLVKLNPTPIV